MTERLIVRTLGLVEYNDAYEDMVAFTEQRDANTPDELWLLEHHPVFTQGRAGRAEHLLHTGDIPVVQSDRGGQVTYHGPGQLTAYVLVDLKRKQLGVRDLVSAIEQSIVDAVATFGISASPKPDAPGVYVLGSKLASLGLRIRQGKSFHGLALNVDMNMEPFLRINPCGYAGMEMVQVNDLSTDKVTVKMASAALTNAFKSVLNYNDVQNVVGRISRQEVENE